MWAVSQDHRLAMNISKLQVIEKNGKWCVGASPKTILAVYNTKLQAMAAIEMAMCRMGKDHVFNMPDIEMAERFIQESIEFNKKHVWR